MLKSNGRISPFNNLEEDHYMLCTAIKLFDDVWLQPPHWDREPTKEMLQEEEKLENKMVKANEEIKRLAGEIYLSLTGEIVVGTKKL